MNGKKGRASEIDTYIGCRLRYFRKLSGFTQDKLASEVNITFQQLQKYENGINRVSAARLYQFTKIFNMKTDAFFDGLEKGQPEKASSLDLLSNDTLRLIKELSRIPDEKKRKVAIKAFIPLIKVLQG